MIDAVDRTLRNWRRSNFEWSEHNCLLSIADYVFDVTGIDFGKKYRKDCKDETSAMRLLEKHGGTVEIIDETGLLATLSPERGDILAVQLDKIVPAICTGQGAAMRLITGVVEVDLRLLKIKKAWKVI